MARLAAAATCGAAFGDDGDDGDDAVVEPPGLPMLAPSGADERGETDLGWSLLVTAAVTVVACGVSIAVEGRPLPAGVAKRGAVASGCGAALASIALAYLAPNVLQYGVTLAVHGSLPPSLPVGAGCGAAVLLLASGVFVVCLPPSGGGGGAPELASARPPTMRERLRAGVWAPFYDCSRDESVLRLRLCGFEDLAVAGAIAALSGVHPTSEFGCRAVAASMLLTAVLHAAYTVALRPLKEATELKFAVLNAAILVAMAALTMAIVVRGWQSAIEPLGYALAVIDALFFVELGVLGVGELREALANHEPSHTAGQDDANAVPMLAVVPQQQTVAALLAASGPVANPLLRTE